MIGITPDYFNCILREEIFKICILSTYVWCLLTCLRSVGSGIDGSSNIFLILIGLLLTTILLIRKKAMLWSTMESLLRSKSSR